jgi:hypothetical protein
MTIHGNDPVFVSFAAFYASFLWIVFFRDPEGNIIELMEGYRD